METAKNQFGKKIFPYEKSTVKTALKMAWPAIIESFFMCFVGLVDSLMVSKLGPDAVASVGLTTQPKFIGMAVFFATGVSLSAIVARRKGEGNQKDANEILTTALLFLFIIAIGVSVLFVSGADTIIRWCGSSANTHEGAVVYFKIIMGGIIFNCISIGINSAQRGAGNTKITMYTNVTSNVVNVIFNYLLIGGNFGFPKLGIAGAAIATVFGSFVSCIISILSLFRKNSFLSFRLIIKEKITPTWRAFKRLVKFGYSVFMEQILLRFGFMATAVMAAKMGDDSMAAHQVAMNIMSLSFSLGDGLQSAAVALIGRSLGEKNEKLAKDYGKTCQALGGVASVIMAIFYIFGAKWLMTLFFENDPQIVEIGVGIVYMIIVIVLFQIRQVIYMGCLRGAGDTLYTAVVSIICVTIIRTVVSYIGAFPLDWGIIGVWLGVLADQIARFIFASIRFRQGKWLKIKV